MGVKTDHSKKGLSHVARVLMGVASIEVILLAFLPILSVSGVNYCGWKVTFYYWGKQYIYNYHEFGFNSILASSFTLSIIVIGMTLLKWKKVSGKKRAIYQLLVAALLLYCGVAYFNALSLVEKTASETMFNTIYYAKNASEYLLATYPVVNLVVCVCVAAVQIISAIFELKTK